MKNTIVILLFSLGMPAWAESVNSVPQSIFAQQRLLVSQGTCESRWEEMASEGMVNSIPLNSRTQLWVVPCAMWAYNMAWTVYVTIQEASHPDGFITKPMTFVAHSLNERISASQVIYNPKFDSETQSLLSQYAMNGQPQCGFAAEYEWKDGAQVFAVTHLAANDDCKDPGKWDLLIKP